MGSNYLMKIKNVAVILVCLAVAFGSVPAHAQSTQSGSIGIEGTVPADAPDQAATITVPGNGQVFTEIPITVSGLCPVGLLVKIFKNNVFAGSVQCGSGSYSIPIDLFNGQNELVARVYDELDQAGPDSNIVTVTFNDNRFATIGTRVSLTSAYAKRGANPGEQLTWPIILSGGTGPYAISVDWGDNTDPDLISQPFAGTFDIKHVYERAGVYNIIVKATDSNGAVAFLQVVGIANGAIAEEAAPTDAVRTVIRVIWWPAVALFPLLLLAFWLGKRHEVTALRQRLEQSSKN